MPISLVSLKRIVPFAALTIVGLIGVWLFFAASRPISQEAVLAQRYVDALCKGELANLYPYVWDPANNPAAFREAAAREQANVPADCYGDIEYNRIQARIPLVRPRPEIERVHIVPIRVLKRVEGDPRVFREPVMGLDLTVVTLKTGEQKMLPDFMGISLSEVTPFGESGTVYASEGIGWPLGTARIVESAKILRYPEKILIGIKLRLLPTQEGWEYLNLYLNSGKVIAKAVTNWQDLPREYQSTFWNTGGRIVAGPNEGTFWFEIVPQDFAPDQLRLTIHVATKLFQNHIDNLFEVKVDPAWSEVYDALNFNPFVSAQMQSEPDKQIASVNISTDKLAEGEIVTIRCQEFWLILDDNRWVRPSDCNKEGQQYEQSYPAGLTRLWIIEFSSSAPGKRLIYLRGGDRQNAKEFPLWPSLKE